MTIATSTDWTVTRDNIITYAYRKIGVVSEDGTPSTAQYTHGAMLLNGIVKSWNASLGMPLWSLKTAYLLPVSGTSQASIGTGGGHVTASYTTTTLSAASATSDTTIDVSTAPGSINGYYIGVELDNGDMHWTTVNGNPPSTEVTLTTGVSSAASSGNRVYYYQTKLARPLRVTKAYSKEVAGDSDTPIEIITSHEYMELSIKSTESYPIKLYYDPQIDPGIVNFWPRFSNGDRIVVMQVVRPLGDFDATGDNPDFPQEWNLPLILELACLLAPDYGLEPVAQGLLRKQADKWIDMVSQNDYEEGTIQFTPNLSMR
jgi:hypothetical protein